jgi:hypothetical protein
MHLFGKCCVSPCSYSQNPLFHAQACQRQVPFAQPGQFLTQQGLFQQQGQYVPAQPATPLFQNLPNRNSKG